MKCHGFLHAVRRPATLAVATGLVLVRLTAACSAASFEDNIKSIRAVGPEGAGHPAAIAAVKELSHGSAETLVPLLKAFDDASPLAVNWLRGAFDSVADRQLKASNLLPTDKLEAFVKDTAQNAEARRLAYEWLIKVDPSASDRLIPGMLRDASPEFRRDAVQRLIKAAAAAQEASNQKQSIKLYREALAGAVDDDQVKSIVTPLREMKEQVDLQKHFGFLTEWYLAGPFDNTGMKGFNVAYPPEKGVDLAAKYEGKLGEVTWQKLATSDEYGVFNVAKQTSPYKGAAMYAYTTFMTDKARSVDIRLGTPNAWKLWVNGELVFGRDEYHRGTQLDQYRVKAKLRPGNNTILLKICQNEQTDDWAQDYKYQIRVCDSTGAAILPSPAATTSRVDR
ncbi:MAG: hypothetical protein JSS49_06920 [Planctomycetes bacterium]|nr:hypothetical protein [Planctomycetota bacterium]